MAAPPAAPPTASPPDEVGPHGAAQPPTAPRPARSADATVADRVRAAPADAPPRVGPGLAGAAAWSWRVLLVVGAGVALLALLRFFALVALPLCFAVLLSALLHPITSRLRRRGMTRALSTVVSLLVAVVVIGGLGWFATTQVIAGYPSLVSGAGASIGQLGDLVQKIPGTSSLGLDTIESKLVSELKGNVSTVASSVLAAGTAVGEVVTALVVTVFATFFFVDQGDRIFSWLVRLLPSGVQPSVCGAGYRAWYVLSGWIGGTAVVAIIHGLVIGIVLAALGVPLALPLALVITVGSFLPVVGIFIGGALAVLVALLAKGWVIALVVVLVVVAEDQLEAHLLQPLVVGRAVQLHPVAIVVALTAGAVVAGFWGALLAVPVAAAGNAAVLYLTGLEDVHGNRRRGGDRTEPMRPPAYAPLPFLGIEQEVAAVRYSPDGDAGSAADDGEMEGREPVHEPTPRAPGAVGPGGGRDGA